MSIYIIFELIAYCGLICGIYQYIKGSRKPIQFEEKTIKIEI